MAPPTLFTPELAQTICDRVAAGETMTRICRDADMPDRVTVFRWERLHEAFRNDLVRAREDRIAVWAEEILEIADDATNDYRTVNRDGEEVELVNHEHITRSKLRTDNRKWLIAKLAPKQYGDKVTTELTGANGGPVETKEVTHVDRAKALAFIFERAKAEMETK